MTKFLIISIALVAIVAPLKTWAFSAGAPTGVCGELTPHHREFTKKTTNPPYDLEFENKNEFYGNQKYKGFIKGKNDQDLLKGFIIQARIGETAIGHFIPGLNSQAIDCGNEKQSTLTHTKITGDGVNRIDFEWQAPNVSGDVHFRVTYVKNFTDFWVVEQKDSRKVNLKLQ